MKKEFVFYSKDGKFLDLNYRYDMFCSITKTITNHFGEIGEELHNSKKIKMFCFSALNSTPYTSIIIKNEKKLISFGEKIFFRMASFNPAIITMFEQAIIEAKVLNIRGKELIFVGSKNIDYPDFKEEMTWIPHYFGGIVTRQKNSNNFIFPNSPDECKEIITNNLISKYSLMHDLINDQEKETIEKNYGKITSSDEIKIEFIGDFKRIMNENMKKTGNVIRIFSWACPVKIVAPKIIQKLIFDAGLGSLNSQGYGLVNEYKTN